ncbi:MAG: PfkB family carbohydrate kinase [Candidatus Pacebacteria bacterium]|nr:PfkB family carbohydrate kinase [Candidatus Paceibacterota bacterium]
MKTSEENIEFVAIGDTVIDAFIRLKIARENHNAESGALELCMPFADKIPYDFAEEVPAVGNSANAAVSAARLGLKAALVTDIGGDQHGRECLDRLHKETVDTSLITVHQDLNTNYHYVLWFEKERTILIKHETYPYKLPEIISPKWLYLSSLGENALDYHKQIEQYLIAHPEVNLVFQPGTFQIKLGKEALAEIYKRSKVFFCNVEEAELILGMPNAAHPGTQEKRKAQVKILLEKIAALGPEIVVITDGPDGAYARYVEKNQVGQENTVVSLFVPEYPDPRPAYERTGAGDAFSSTFIVALVLGKDISEALKWGCVNSASVVQQVGAQKGLLNREQLEKFLLEAPQGWSVDNI